MTRKYAADDHDLNAGALIVSRRKTYTDIDCLFKASPLTGDLYLSKDAAAVKQAVINLIMMNHYETPFQPFKGANVRAMLFENLTPFVVAQLEADIRTTLDSYEPRAKTLNIRAVPEPSRDRVVITVEVQVISTRENVVIEVQLRRLR